MDDRARVEELIGRRPRCAFDVVVRTASGDPVVVRNAPFLDDGTPMPTRFYLVGADLVRAVSRIEAAGGVRQAEAELDAELIAATHAAYEAERDSAIAPDHVGPRPSGGVGGTRRGVKCLHAHVGHLLAGGADVVGDWTLQQLGADSWVLDGLQPPAPVPTSEPAPAEASTRRESNPDIGGLTLHITDDEVHVSMTGGGTWVIPLGAATLAATTLTADPPRPAELTNALGLVHDHFDDIAVEAPSVLATPSVVATGPHAEAIAHVELGHTDVPADYLLTRRDADDVFRTLVAEPIAERRSNPALAADQVETIVAALCIVLAVMRRLELGEIGIRSIEDPS